ncbi:hypothetical protein M0R89_12240 [Halorussus limi]|uniref:Uncharacterized protein n=1 Tax=Halorussus limi TaxID=2938695 RepID=A0A8U0HRE4_9EURY|nr:hypothetical protein [Halorussus limi]UPV73313.1 hypothetical protein M0R89_12240 [Halorussus limi]
MRLAEDRRGRVPFALVGVVLLVASAGLSASLAGGPTPRTDDSVGVAVERATAATNTALRDAVARAGRRAASAPVTAVANTTAGRALNDSTPFRDALRLRIYLAARESLGEVGVRTGGSGSAAVSASVSLPAIRNASDLRAAKRRVEVDPAGANGSAENAGLRVRIRNVTVTATRDGRVVERERLAPELVVATPALALHERVERFESRLDRGPLAPGLGRRLTARLYAVAWARGYAQYGGAPVENVVANRHVELAANGALLREQRAAFGRTDPRARRAVRWATARVGATDLLTAANAHYGSARTDQLLAAARDYQKRNPMPGGVTSGNPTDSRETRRSLRVGVNRTADRAFAGLVTGANGTDLSGVLRSAYAADARLVAAVREVESEARPAPESPGANWTLRSSEVRTRTAVESGVGDLASAPTLGTPEGRHLLGAESRRVVRTRTLVAEWTREGGARGNGTTGSETRRTVQRWTETFAVRVGVAGDHDANSEFAPSRPVSGVHERGGALGGPNLRDLSQRATEELVESRGGFDAAARRAVAGTLDTRPERVAGRRPDGLRRWVYRDLVGLRERVRNLSVTVARRRAVGGPPPTAELARAVRSRRAALLDAPGRYDGAADRARVAARAAYLDRVVARLESRADREERTRSGVKDALADAGVSLDRVRRILRARTTPETSPPRPLPADGPGSAVNLSVSGAPPYLTLAGLDHEQVAAIPAGEEKRPLAARNLNVFAVPYGDAAESVAAAAVGDGGSGRTDLRTAALALRAANRTLAEADNQSLARRRDALRRSLAASMRNVRRELVGGLALSRFDLSAAERRAAVESALARWNTTAGRALAVANGTAGRAVAAAVVRGRPALRRPDRRDWVRLRAELAVESVRERVAGPTRSTVNETASVTRQVARTALKQAVASGLANATEVASKRWFGEALGAVPAGLPVAPVPGYWYATLNVWSVEVLGEYARFAVSAPQGPPGESVTYVRESATVRLDWDGDGESEVVGRTTPVGFETETVVAVVVPPGPPGVGDRGGNRDETSPGWP